MGGARSTCQKVNIPRTPSIFVFSLSLPSDSSPGFSSRNGGTWKGVFPFKWAVWRCKRLCDGWFKCYCNFILRDVGGVTGLFSHLGQVSDFEETWLWIEVIRRNDQWSFALRFCFLGNGLVVVVCVTFQPTRETSSLLPLFRQLPKMYHAAYHFAPCIKASRMMGLSTYVAFWQRSDQNRPVQSFTPLAYNIIHEAKKEIRQH